MTEENAVRYSDGLRPDQRWMSFVLEQFLEVQDGA